MENNGGFSYAKGELMEETLSPDLSQKNPHYIPRERFYELRHFCLQYKDWHKELRELDSFVIHTYGEPVYVATGDLPDPVYDAVVKRDRLTKKKSKLSKRQHLTWTPFSRIIFWTPSRSTLSMTLSGPTPISPAVAANTTRCSGNSTGSWTN